MAPQALRPLNLKLTRMTAVATSPAPPQLMTRSLWASMGLSNQLRPKFTAPRTAMRTKDQRHPIVEANQPR